MPKARKQTDRRDFFTAIVDHQTHRANMPWMPDQGPLNQGNNGGVDTQSLAAVSSESDIRAVEKRILSSTEHLNEILNLLALLTVSITDHLDC